MNKTAKHFIDLPDIPPEALKDILRRAHEMKRLKFRPPQILQGLSLAMVFDKRSTRTRISFEVAMKQLGGHTIVMNMDEMQIGGGENIEDTANVLSRFVDGVMVRMGDHAALCELARHSRIPVINGLTDRSHPCQIMADLMTIEEKLGGIGGKKITWLGDYNNVARTFAQAAPIWGFELVVSCPEEIMPPDTPHLNPPSQGGRDFGLNSPPLMGEGWRGVHFESNPQKAAKNSDVIVTDTWVSMGEEGKTIEKFLPYQVNAELMALAKDTAIFMHCMPVHRGEEVTNEVLASPASVVYDEAENRLHAQKAILAWCLEEAGVNIQAQL